MHELPDHDLEHVAAGKMPRAATEDTLAAYRKLAENLARNGDRIGDAADALRDMLRPKK